MSVRGKHSSKLIGKCLDGKKNSAHFPPENHVMSCGTVFKVACRDLHKQTRPAAKTLNISVNLLLFLMTVIGSESELSWLDESQN